MSFFGSTKNMGLVIIIAGIITLIGGIISAAGTISENNDNLLANILIALGALVVGIGLLWAGINIRKASDGSEALRIFVRVFGLIIIISAILSLAAAIVGNNTVDIVGFIVSLIIGLIILWIGNKIAGKNKNVLSKLLWIILIIAFIILALMRLMAAINGFGTSPIDVLGLFIVNICMFLAFLMALVLMFSPDVKKAML